MHFLATIWVAASVSSAVYAQSRESAGFVNQAEPASDWATQDIEKVLAENGFTADRIDAATYNTLYYTDVGARRYIVELILNTGLRCVLDAERWFFGFVQLKCTDASGNRERDLRYTNEALRTLEQRVDLRELDGKLSIGNIPNWAQLPEKK